MFCLLSRWVMVAHAGMISFTEYLLLLSRGRSVLVCLPYVTQLSSVWLSNFVISENWFCSFEFEERNSDLWSEECRLVDTYSGGRVVIGRYDSVREWVRWHDNVKMVSRLIEFRFSECPQKTSQCLFFLVLGKKTICIFNQTGFS